MTLTHFCFIILLTRRLVGINCSFDLCHLMVLSSSIWRSLKSGSESIILKFSNTMQNSLNSFTKKQFANYFCAKLLPFFLTLTTLSLSCNSFIVYYSYSLDSLLISFGSSFHFHSSMTNLFEHQIMFFFFKLNAINRPILFGKFVQFFWPNQSIMLTFKLIHVDQTKLFFTQPQCFKPKRPIYYVFHQRDDICLSSSLSYIYLFNVFCSFGFTSKQVLKSFPIDAILLIYFVLM